ncbi:hypothetical protein BGZ65_005223, partial [Modicella reniformis]
IAALEIMVIGKREYDTQVNGDGTDSNHNGEVVPQVTSSSPSSTPLPSPPVKAKRLRSLDILRGITIIFMILVNTQGADPFVQLAHSEWFGYTLADWVFPNFIFMVGMAVAIVLSPSKLTAMSQEEAIPPRVVSFRNGHQKRLRMSLKIIKRSILLFTLGIALAALGLIGVPKEQLWVRIPGVLQRISFCYLVLAMSVLWAPVGSASVQVGLPVVCTTLWFILTYSIQSTATEPLPGCQYPPSLISPEGDILPGGPPVRGQLSPSWCTAQAFLDTILVSQKKDPNNPVFDSEGTIGNLTAIVTAWFGWMMGSAVMEQQRQQKTDDKRLITDFEAQAAMEEERRKWEQSSEGQQTIQSGTEHRQSSLSTQVLQYRLQVQRRSSQLAHLGEWFMVGVCVMYGGTILGWFLPICKGLWTPSFTLHSAGISIIALCILIFLYDIAPVPSTKSTTLPLTGKLAHTSKLAWQKIERGLLAFGRGCAGLLICYGRNPTLIYVLSEVVKFILDMIHVDGKFDWIKSVWSYLFFNSFITFMPAPWASLIFSLVYILLFAPLMWYLNKKRIYLRL